MEDKTCKDKILETLSDGKPRTAYELHHLIGYSYRWTYWCVRELALNKILKIDRAGFVKGSQIPKYYYTINLSEKSAKR